MSLEASFNSNDHYQSFSVTISPLRLPLEATPAAVRSEPASAELGPLVRKKEKQDAVFGTWQPVSFNTNLQMLAYHFPPSVAR